METALKHILYEYLRIPTDEGDLLPPCYDVVWRGTKRTCELLFRNVRELPLDSFEAVDGIWRIIIDFPFDQPGYTPAFDLAKIQEFQTKGEVADTLVWLPSFLTPKAQEDLGRLSLLDQVLSGNRLNEYGGHLSQTEREQARVFLDADRYKTVEAASALLVEIQAGEGDAIIESLAKATIATPETAMGQAIKGARQVADALQNAEWMIFEKIGALVEPYKVRAEGIVSLVTNALTHDEHVSSLASTLRQAQSEAITLLADAATRPPPPRPEPPQPEPPVPGRKLAKQGRKTVKASEAKHVFAEIESDLSDQTGATLEVDWKVYREE